MDEAVLAGLEILVVEDDVMLSRRVTAFLKGRGAEVSSAKNLEEAFNLLDGFSFDVVLTDIHLPDGDGRDILRQKRCAETTRVLVMTSEGGIAVAVEAMQLGASDFLAKPFDLEELPLKILRSRKVQKQERLQAHRESKQEAGGLVFGKSMQGVKTMLDRILEMDARLDKQLPPVLLMGGTGTGKTSIARWLHRRGPRADKPLVEVNCGALPENLAESELFGHERGAFTDAKEARMGLFEAADGGTLFLDELPSLSPGLQAKVLKVLEDHEVRRVGGRKSIPVDVRVIAAAMDDLQDRVADGRFREDLYHRLDLLRIQLPPLAERREELVDLAESLLAGLCKRYKVARRRFSREGRERLLSYGWPGNVRELSHELERSLVFERGEEVDLAMLASACDGQAGVGLSSEEWFNPAFVFPEEGFDLEAAVRELIQHALKQSDGNVSAAARLLGVNRDYIRYRIKE